MSYVNADDDFNCGLLAVLTEMGQKNPNLT
jgi:hypothetical protein